jgi:hypothetical protein
VDWTDITPVDAFMELGGSLRATMAHVEWIEKGDPYLLGATYWAPFDRQIFTRVIPGREQIALEDDARLPQTLMDEREGAVGGSVTGEAYYNFGPIGPFVVLTFVGVLFGWSETLAMRSVAGCVTLGIVMSPFLLHIRGGWLPVPATIAEGLILLACCQFVGQFVLPRQRVRSTETDPSVHALARG